MPTYTIEINQLDTITKHLIEINQQLLAIKHDTAQSDASRIILIILTATSPLIVGFVLFLLNRNKEHHQKKSELCGEIYAYIEELKMANGDWITTHIHFLAALRNNQIVNDQIFSETERQTANKIVEDLKKELDSVIDKHNEVLKNLSKQVGTYRFYLAKRKRSEIDNLMNPFLHRIMFTYDFSDISDTEEVIDQAKKLIQAYTDEQTPIDNQRYNALLEFVDEQNPGFFPSIE